MKTVLLLALSLVACAPQGNVLCETSCGLKLIGPIPYQDNSLTGDYSNMPWWTCENLQDVEDKTLALWQTDVVPHDPRFKDYPACQSMNGMELWVHTEEFFWSPDHNSYVEGEAHCDIGYIEVGARPPYTGILTHELSHVAQHCDPKGPPVPRDAGESDAVYEDANDHANWERDGIRQAINDMLTQYYTPQWTACHEHEGVVDAGFCE